MTWVFSDSVPVKNSRNNAVGIVDVFLAAQFLTLHSVSVPFAIRVHRAHHAPSAMRQLTFVVGQKQKDGMDINIKDEKKKSILQLLQSGRKIEAIKLVREEVGCGLKEAKDFVESFVDADNKDLPEVQKIGKSGCLVFLLIGIMFVATLYHIA